MKRWLVRLAIATLVPIAAAGVALGGCVSSTVLHTWPSGAHVYIDGAHVGTTPYTYSDAKVAGSVTKITLAKEGYRPLYVDLVRNERAAPGAIIGGLFLLVPFLWVMKYAPEHKYTLAPGTDGPPPPGMPGEGTPGRKRPQPLPTDR